MPLPRDIRTPDQLRQALQHYTDNHNQIKYFVYGKFQQLAEKVKATKKNEYVLFCPYPSIIPRDRSGSFDNRFLFNIALVTPIRKNDFDAESIALNESLQRINELLIRMRSDASDYGWSFNINDINQMDPVIDYMLDNATGYQAPIYFGDFLPVKVDHSVWNDLS